MTIQASELELRAGSRLLLSGASFRIGPGDKVGLVGRNGAGKTTLTRVLAGESEPAAGTVVRSGTLGYLPQDPREVDLDGDHEGPDPVGARAGRGRSADAGHGRAGWPAPRARSRTAR